MNQVYPDLGLQFILLKVIGDGLEYHLFKNDAVVDRELTLADLDECDTFGYAPITVISDDWPNVSIVDHIIVRTANPIAFSPDGGDWTLYGFYVTYPGETTVLYAGKFDSVPYVVPDGDTIVLIPVVGGFSKRPT